MAMRTQSKAFLYELLNTPSPTGFEQPVQRIVRRYVKSFADSVTTDLHGNVIVGLNVKAPRRVMLAGHCDQIGFMVSHINKDGFVYLNTLGGIDTGVLYGSHVTIHNDRGPIQGVIGRKPIHLQTDEERGRNKVEIDKVWVDIGAKNRKDAEKMVAISDPVTFRLGITEMPNDLISSVALDDKVGLFVVMEALRLCSESKINVALYSVSTVQEEVGLRGAQTATFTIDPEVGIAVDVTHATDNPGNDTAKVAPCICGGGPVVYRGPNVNPVVEKMLEAAAKKAKIAVQPGPANRPMGNDANAIQVARGGVAAASIGIPNRYMHTQIEICSLKDLESSAKLLARFVQDIGPKVDFRPL